MKEKINKIIESLLYEWELLPNRVVKSNTPIEIQEFEVSPEIQYDRYEVKTTLEIYKNNKFSYMVKLTANLRSDLVLNNATLLILSEESIILEHADVESFNKFYEIKTNASNLDSALKKDSKVEYKPMNRKV